MQPSWIFKNAIESFDEHRQQWDEINRMQANSLVLDSRFVAPLIRHFAYKTTLLAISTNDKYPAMALLERTRAGFWQTFQPSQAPLGLIVLGNRDHPRRQIAELMSSLSGFSLLLTINQQDPDLSVFRSTDSLLQGEVVPWIRTARVTLTGPQEEFWKRRPSKSLTKKLRSARQRLLREEKQLQFVEDRDASRVAYGVREHGVLESAGWKGKSGTAIAADNAQGLFYREMLENFCRDNQGVIYRLTLNGRTLASELCIEMDGVMVDLKTAYDESVERLSPGSLIMEDIIRSLFTRGRTRVVEFYGPSNDWTSQWSDEFRVMYHVNLFRHPSLSMARRALKASFDFFDRQSKRFQFSTRNHNGECRTGAAMSHR